MPSSNGNSSGVRTPPSPPVHPTPAPIATLAGVPQPPSTLLLEKHLRKKALRGSNVASSSWRRLQELGAPRPSLAAAEIIATAKALENKLKRGEVCTFK